MKRSMKIRSRIFITVCALVSGACLLVFLVGSQIPREPVYQGKPLRFWLTELTKHGEFDLSPPDQAAKAVREIGPAAVPFLIQWLPESDRRMSGLESVLSKVPVLGGLLHELRRRPEPPVNSDAIVAAFRVLGPDARSALPRLAKILEAKRFSMRDYETWHTACEAVPWIGAEALPVMLTAVTNLQGVHERWELVKQFGILGSNGVPAIPALIAWSSDSDYFVRIGAVSALGNIGQQPEVVVPVLRAALADQEAVVRRDAAEALGSFGSAVIPDLIQALKDPDWNARMGAFGGLGKLALEKPDIVLPLLEEGLRGANGRSAAYALGYSGSRAAFNILMAATNIFGIGDIIYQVQATVRPEDLR